MRLQRVLHLVFALFVAGLLSACGTAPTEYKDTKPEFRIEEYFQGQVQAWGMFQDLTGKVRRRFSVDIQGYRDGEVFVLEERFEYADGETDQRTWRIESTGEHSYRGTAGDIVGTASGTQYGYALNWRYTLELPVDGETWEVSLDDWLYRLDDGVLVNRASVSKYGIEIGQLTIFFRREDAP